MLPRADTKRRRMVGTTRTTSRGDLTESSKTKGNPWDHVWAPKFCPACHEDLFIRGCVDVNFQVGRETTKHDDEEQPELTEHELPRQGGVYEEMS